MLRTDPRMILRDHISQLPDNRLLIRTDNSVCFRDDFVCDAPLGRPSGNVALCFSDVAKLVKHLVTYDGSAKRLVLLAPSFNSKLIHDLARLSECHVLIFDSETRHLNPIKGEVSDDKSGLTDWVLATSGTTNTPKLVSHKLSSLSSTTKTDTVRGAGQKWGMLYDPSRFAGLQVLLQSLLSGAELLAPPYNWTLEKKIDFFIEHGCTHLSCTPTLWRKIIMCSHASNMSLVQATLGGEIADQRILNVLSQKFPHARVSHIYASTETGVGFAVSDRMEGFPKELFNSSTPGGLSLKEKDGRLFIRSPEARGRYLNSHAILSSADGWVDTGDRIVLRNDRYYFLGRESGVINVGGDKVHPEAIENFLSSIEGVREARVYGKKNPITGAIVVADIVLEDPTANNKEMQKYLHQYSTEKLSRYQVPAIFKFVKEIEVNAAGKIVRPKL